MPPRTKVVMPSPLTWPTRVCHGCCAFAAGGVEAAIEEDGGDGGEWFLGVSGRM
jgi:hypothetical protein